MCKDFEKAYDCLKVMYILSAFIPIDRNAMGICIFFFCSVKMLPKRFVIPNVVTFP